MISKAAQSILKIIFKKEESSKCRKQICLIVYFVVDLLEWVLGLK